MKLSRIFSKEITITQNQKVPITVTITQNL